MTNAVDSFTPDPIYHTKKGNYLENETIAFA